jgi:hypothetical protein
MFGRRKRSHCITLRALVEVARMPDKTLYVIIVILAAKALKSQTMDRVNRSDLGGSDLT